MSNTFYMDPTPEEWLSAARIDNLRSELGDAIYLMRNAGAKPAVLHTGFVVNLVRLMMIQMQLLTGLVHSGSTV